MAFELPPLPYDYDALAPFMSRETLEYHHDKHHKAYVDNGNKLAEEAGLAGLSLEEIVKKSYGTNQGLFNNAGQHYNHVHFWKWMKKGGGGKSLPGTLQKAIDSDLGGYDKFKADFVAAGTTQFGSGWAWLSVNEEGRRRQEPAGRPSEGHRQRPRRLRQVQGRFHRRRHHAVRLGLGLALRQGRQARHLQDPER